MIIDPKTAYWTCAWINMLGIVGCTIAGVRQIRRKNVISHRRWMLSAAFLTVLFLASYPFKLVFLGREALETWDWISVAVLRFHEVCVVMMLVSGGSAFYLATKHGFIQMFSNPGAVASDRSRLHRRMGRAAMVSAVLGALTAGYVLLGMYQRL